MNDTELEGKREKTLDILTQAYAHDVLSVDEYERRVTEVQATLDTAALDDIAAEMLPALRGASAAANTEYMTPMFSGARTASIPRTGLQDVICVMGEKTLRGNWLSSDNVNEITVMGETVMDLRECVLPRGALNIHLKTVMGETKIIVPADASVLFDVKVILGEGTVKSGVSLKAEPGKPSIVITGICVMGEVLVATS